MAVPEPAEPPLLVPLLAVVPALAGAPPVVPLPARELAPPLPAAAPSVCGLLEQASASEPRPNAHVERKIFPMG